MSNAQNVVTSVFSRVTFSTGLD